MLDASLLFLKDRLNSHIDRLGGAAGDGAEDKVVFPDGEKSDPLTFKLGAVTLILVNVEEERVLRQADRYQRTTAEGVLRINPDLRLELAVLFAARFKTYDQSLKMISAIIRYFQSNPSFDAQTSPDLDPAIQRLTLELMPLPLSEQNDLWNVLRTTYLPSVLYKVRMLVFADAAGSAATPITDPVRELRHARGTAA